MIPKKKYNLPAKQRLKALSNTIKTNQKKYYGHKNTKSHKILTEKTQKPKTKPCLKDKTKTQNQTMINNT